MKIIASDNYARETVADIVVVDKITNTYYAKLIVSLLNNRLHIVDSDKYYKLVEDDYLLSCGLEDLI